MLKDFIINNFAASMAVITIILTFLVLLVVFVFYSAKVAYLKNDIVKSIIKNRFEDFLINMLFVNNSVFDENYLIDLAAKFIDQNLNVKTFSRVYDVFIRLGTVLSAQNVFKRAFSLKSSDFWMSLYVHFFIEGQNREAEELKNLFDYFPEEKFRKVWELIYRDLNRYETNMLHVGNEELVQSLQIELQRISVLLGR